MALCGLDLSHNKTKRCVGSSASHLYKTIASSVLAELADLPLIRLDFSCNKITEIPLAYRKLRQLQHIILDNNPMQSPPAQVRAVTTWCSCLGCGFEPHMWCWICSTSGVFWVSCKCGGVDRILSPSRSYEPGTMAPSSGKMNLLLSVNLSVYGCVSDLSQGQSAHIQVPEHPSVSDG